MKHVRDYSNRQKRKYTIKGKPKNEVQNQLERRGTKWQTKTKGSKNENTVKLGKAADDSNKKKSSPLVVGLGRGEGVRGRNQFAASADRTMRTAECFRRRRRRPCEPPKPPEQKKNNQTQTKPNHSNNKRKKGANNNNNDDDDDDDADDDAGKSKKKKGATRKKMRKGAINRRRLPRGEAWRWRRRPPTTPISAPLPPSPPPSAGDGRIHSFGRPLASSAYSISRFDSRRFRRVDGWRRWRRRRRFRVPVPRNLPQVSFQSKRHFYGNVASLLGFFS